jgi:hypothetical protein
MWRTCPSTTRQHGNTNPFPRWMNNEQYCTRIDFNQKVGFGQKVNNFILWIEHLLLNVVWHSTFIKVVKITYESRTYYKPPSYHGLCTNLLK